MIRKAQMNDIDKIEIIIADIKAEMKRINNLQWDDDYPKTSHFINDIKDENLYVYVGEDDEIKGLICINLVEPSEYKSLNWSLDKKAIILHRMAVSLSSRKQGIATTLMQFAEKLAIKQGIHYIRTDTYSTNKKMNLLFKKLGYKHVGYMSFQGRPYPFNCYDKQLSR